MMPGNVKKNNGDSSRSVFHLAAYAPEAVKRLTEVSYDGPESANIS
jgi:hypothetical protein